MLDWTTRLEKAGVGGTDFSFTDSDRQKAQGAAMHITIGTVEQFTGNLGHGNVSGAITSGALDVDGVRTLMTEMRRYAGELVKAGANAKSLEGKIGMSRLREKKSANTLPVPFHERNGGRALPIRSVRPGCLAPNGCRARR